MPIPFLGFGLVAAIGVISGIVLNDVTEADNVPVVNVAPQPRPIPSPFTLGLYGVSAIAVFYAANKAGVLKL